MSRRFKFDYDDRMGIVRIFHDLVDEGHSADEAARQASPQRPVAPATIRRWWIRELKSIVAPTQIDFRRIPKAIRRYPSRIPGTVKPA